MSFIYLFQEHFLSNKSIFSLNTHYDSSKTSILQLLYSGKPSIFNDLVKRFALTFKQRNDIGYTVFEGDHRHMMRTITTFVTTEDEYLLLSHINSYIDVIKTEFPNIYHTDKCFGGDNELFKIVVKTENNFKDFQIVCIFLSKHEDIVKLNNISIYSKYDMDDYGLGYFNNLFNNNVLQNDVIYILNNQFIDNINNFKYKLNNCLLYKETAIHFQKYIQTETLQKRLFNVLFKNTILNQRYDLFRTLLIIFIYKS